MTGKATSRRLRTAAALVAAALCAGACSSLAPDYSRPPLPVPADYPPPPPGSITSPGGPPETRADADTGWRDFFTDARLLALIELALANNRDLRIAALNIEQTRALYQVRRADIVPTVNVGVGGSRQPLPSGAATTVYTAGLIASAWEVDFFGRLRNLSDVALAQFAATAEARNTVQGSIVAAVATVYLSQLSDDAQIALTRQTLASREDSLRLTKLRFDNGASSELDYRQAESLVETARAALAQQLRQRALDDNALQLLVGRSLPPGLPAGRTLAETTLTPRLEAGLPSELLLRRPEIRQAELTLRGADANIGAARAAFFPRITLTGSIGVVSADLKGLFTDGRYGWSFGPQIVLPIFDGGRNRANLGVAQVGRELAVAQYERAVQTSFREVADALAARATLDEQLRAQQAQADAEQTRFRLSDLRYRNGVSSYLDLLDAQRSLFTAQLAAVQVRAARLQNQVALYKALGGGWSTPEQVGSGSVGAAGAGGGR